MAQSEYALLMERAQAQAASYEGKILNQKASINRLLGRIERLEQQVREMGGTPRE